MPVFFFICIIISLCSTLFRMTFRVAHCRLPPPSAVSVSAPSCSQPLDGDSYPPPVALRLRCYVSFHVLHPVALPHVVTFESFESELKINPQIESLYIFYAHFIFSQCNDSLFSTLRTTDPFILPLLQHRDPFSFLFLFCSFLTPPTSSDWTSHFVTSALSPGNYFGWADPLSM